MKVFFFLILLFCALGTRAQQSVSIIPEPVSIKMVSGTYRLPQNIVIASSSDTAIYVQVLKDRLTKGTGRKVSVAKSPANAAIWLILARAPDQKLGGEGYILKVSSNGVFITANKPAGLFYGVQTLLQLMPASVEGNSATNISVELPFTEITDYPRFGWRGLMLDVARHFFTKEEVKGFIDNMVKYKYNLLHLHLTDDEGWRIEIKGYPKLTEVGAWRVKKEGYFGTFSPPLPDEPKDYGGFFTQDDIRELVQYAGRRFVNILPEIEAPGHSLAAIVSYPELSCTPEAKNYVVRSGEPIMDWSRGAPPIALIDNTMCPANENVYVFLDTVFSQVAKLFPFEYIHVGGDETPRNFWEKIPEIKELMKREDLKSMQAVQGYFEKRVQKILESKGKKFIGWDEVIEGDLEPSAAIMAWRGQKIGAEAAMKGHEVVMSPTSHAYLDYMQGDLATEPRVYASLRLNKTYEFDPLPDGVDPKLIKGGQGNIWSEQLYNMRTVQYMIWPRAFAIAESVWSPKDKKNWNRFSQKVEQHFVRFDSAGIKYSPAMYDPIIEVGRTADKKLRITLSTEVPGLDIYYSFDNSYPDRFYPKYAAPLEPPKDAVMLKMISYRGNKPVGRMMTVQLEELGRRRN